MKRILTAIATFIVATNSFADKNWVEKESWVSRHLDEGKPIQQITGLEYPANWWTAAEWDNIQPVADLPNHFNWGDEYTLQPIRRQRCGDCWAQATTNVVESLFWIFRPLSRNYLAGSVQSVIDCSNYGSCNGGYFGAMSYYKSPGAPHEDNYPYKGKTQRCPGKFEDPLIAISKWAYVGNNGKKPTTEQLKTTIYNYGPISVDIHANSNLSKYGSGVFTSCYAGSTNHMVTIEGWHDDEKYKDYGGGYWIVRNSWGTTWGENGYLKIVYKSKSGSNCNSVANTAVYAVLD